MDALLPLSLIVSDQGQIVCASRSMRKSVAGLALTGTGPFDAVFEARRPSGFDRLRDLADPAFFVVVAERATGNVFKCTKLSGADGFFLLACTPLLNEQNSPVNYGLAVSDFAPHDIIAEYLFVMQANHMGMREANELIDSMTAKNKELEQARKDLVRLNELLEDRATRSEEHLRQAETELIEGEKLALLGRLAAGMAHEINTPLGAISASSHILVSTLRTLFSDSRLLAEHDMLARAFQLADGHTTTHTLTSREERAEKKLMLEHLLLHYWVEDAERHARELVESGVTLRHTAILDQIYSSEDMDTAMEVTTTMLKARRSISIINKAAQSASNVVKALKSYVRNEAGEEATVFDARRSIRDVLLLFNSQMKHGVTLHIDMPDSLHILGSETESSKIWANLISNAIYAMDYKGNLWLEGKADEHTVTLRFINDGPPIPPHVRERMFEPFFTTKPIGEGSGMGLSIIAGILASMQGRITVASDELTIFTIVLPRAAEP